ncbi:MAG TPA: OsmC family protein [Anaeromyxobacteraceae bacterium]|nr:OsmC family protein [Anaeromyxobacteraceae bacterium]
MSEKVKRAIEGLAAGILLRPERAAASFRATTVSESDGFSTRSRVRGFTVPLDEPPELAGEDTGPNPVEAVLAALGSCQAIVYRAYASSLGLRLDRVEVEAVGELDLRGLLGLARVPAGFQRVTFRTRIVSPEPPERIRELAGLVEAHCPVLDTLRLPVEVTGELAHVAPPGDEGALRRTA